MEPITTCRELRVRNDAVTLSGSLWLPAGEPAAAVLMHPGSGASDRHNDVFFPPIRHHLLEHGIAVSSFDKRGVGGSTGRWEEAAIEEQAGDALACTAALLEELPGVPSGLFGHGQGGWVVVDAAARSNDVSFVIASSGPGVTPGEHERYATRTYMQQAGIPTDEVDEVGRYFELLLSLMRARVPFEEVEQRIAREGFPAALDRLSLPVLPESAKEWNHVAALVDYDPRPALERIQVPVLAIFGADDPIVPVAESVAVYREAVQPGLLRVEVIARGDHRLQTGEPPGLAEGYLATLTDFVLDAAA